jgi:hypothetical protein
MDSTLLVLAVAVVVVSVLVFAVIHFFPQTPMVDKQRYQSRWLDIESSVVYDNRDSVQMAILSADKLLDQALKDTGSKGATMGERMKDRQGAWSNANAVWAAHKLRNQIAHEDNVQISQDTARRALASFKQAIKDVGAM